MTAPKAHHAALCPAASFSFSSFARRSSRVAHWALDHWDKALREFVKVMPIEYRNALLRLAKEEQDKLAAEQMAA